ncbi:MAG TPA: lysozyme inhibitor LprI family protein [Rubrivivax sp.]|nr:lysozyme inhibitor LprI family protein [Rubrivivax sp.]
MTPYWRHRSRLRIAAASLALLPLLALAQPADNAEAERAAPPLPERVRTLDESLQHEHDDLVRQATTDAREQGRFAAALKAQHAAWLQYRNASCALHGLLSGAADSVVATRTLQCKAAWTEAQRMQLWSALDCLGQVLPAERAAEHERCLLPLVATPRP